MDILAYAQSGTYWKRIIYDIVSEEDFDPWDIDLSNLTESYLKTIRDMEIVNFEVPGTIILVGSVMLKLKSDIVSGQTFMFEESLETGEESLIDTDEDFVADIDDITGEPLPPSMLDDPQLLVRRIPKRKVTLPELITFLRRVVTQVENKDYSFRTRALDTRIEIAVSEKDMERVIRDVHREIKRSVIERGGNPVRFRELSDEWDRERIIAYLIPILHLATRGKLAVEQKEAYGDILIAPRTENNTKLSSPAPKKRLKSKQGKNALGAINTIKGVEKT